MSPPPSQRSLEIETIQGVTQVTFVASRLLGEEALQALFKPIHSMVTEGGVRKLLLSFRNVEYLSSKALGQLVLLHKQMQAAGGRLILCNLNPNLIEIFKIASLDKALKLKEDAQAALEAFGITRDDRDTEGGE